MSFADGEGALADFFLGREGWQLKSLVDTAEGMPGLQCDLFTTVSKKRVPYQRDAFQHLIAVYFVGSRAYIWIIPMHKLVEKGVVGNTGTTTFRVHMSEEDAEDHPNVCTPLKYKSKHAWTTKYFKGFVECEGMLRA